MRASSLLAFRCYFELPSINKDFTSLHFTVIPFLWPLNSDPNAVVKAQPVISKLKAK